MQDKGKRAVMEGILSFLVHKIGMGGHHCSVIKRTRTFSPAINLVSKVRGY